MKIGHDVAGERDKPHVLDDGSVDGRAMQQDELLLRLRELIGENENIERHVALHTVVVQEIHQAREILRREIGRAHAGVESRQTEVDRVRAIRHRGASTLPVAGGRKQFGL